MAARLSDRPEIEVFDEIERIEHLVRAAVTRQLPPGMNHPQYEVLNLLVRSGHALTPARIARALQMTKGAITNTLQRLAARGLVTIEGDEEDRRKKQVTISTEGLAAYRQALAALRPQVESLRGGFTEKEFREALPFLRALRIWLSDGGRG